MKTWFCSFGLVVLSALGGAPLAQLPPNAPKDQARAVAQQQVADLDTANAPYVATARETYPSARSRFLDGLPPGQTFLVVTRIGDPEGHWEQVFVRVQTIHDGLITGILSSRLSLVTTYKSGQPYTFREPELIDWVITNPDGSEEGNVVGKFLDTYKPADPIERAETTGRALFAAVQEKNFATSQDIRNYEALQRAIDAQSCPHTNISLILLPNREQPTEVFAISSVSENDQIVIGRHFRARVSDATVDLNSLVASTKSCLIMKMRPGAIGVGASELISATPTEFHVLESKLHGLPLYVVAGGTAWTVNNGSIRKLEKLGPK